MAPIGDGWRILICFILISLAAQAFYGMAFQNSALNMLIFASRTCSDKEEIGLDLISHADGKDAGDAFNRLIQCCWLLKML